MYNFKQISTTTGSKYLSYNQWPEGKYVYGSVVTFKPNSKNPKVQDVVITVQGSDIATDKVKLTKGDTFTINGTAALEKVLGSIEEGDILKVVFNGKKPMKSGPYKGQLANDLTVLVAPAQDAGKLEEEHSADAL
jgi:hypothetical protein